MSTHAMPRRRFLQHAAGAAALAAAAPVHGQGAPRRKPNVVYLFSDEHRWQSMSFAETPGLDTPNMARLAREGAACTNCISNYPVCSPYRAILLTGRWPARQGMIDNSLQLSSSEPTIGKAFQSAGYATGYIGKWHLGGERAEPFGFDESLIWTGTSRHWDQAAYHPADGEPVRPKGYNATNMTNQAIEFIETHQAEPFFLMVSWDPPHADFLDAPEGKQALYTPEKLPQRPNAAPHNAIADDPNAGTWGRFAWEYYRGYHGHISAIDDELGRVMAKLDELGIADDTILVYTSDHGTMMGSHSLGGKRQPYEESIRVPFMVRWPGHIPPGTTVDALFGTIGIHPTLCDLAGIGAPKTCEGASYASWFTGGAGPDPEAQLIMHIAKENASGGNNHPAPLFRGVRTKTHTYAVKDGVPWILFDNAADPYQLTNVIDAPEHASLRGRLHAKMIALLNEAGETDPAYLV